MSLFLFFFFFFLMIRRPPRSTLFPTRRSSDLRARARQPEPQSVRRHVRCADRSEEHTSELQSHVNLVCRLLLEKKKKNLYIPFFYTKKKKHEKIINYIHPD